MTTALLILVGFTLFNLGAFVAWSVMQKRLEQQAAQHRKRLKAFAKVIALMNVLDGVNQEKKKKGDGLILSPFQPRRYGDEN